MESNQLCFSDKMPKVSNALYISVVDTHPTGNHNPICSHQSSISHNRAIRMPYKEESMAMEENADREEEEALDDAATSYSRPCICPIVKRMIMLDAANLYQLVVAEKQMRDGMTYKEACWKAFYTTKEHWGERYPFWDEEFGLDVHKDVIAYFKHKKDRGKVLAAALVSHQFMIRTTQLVKLECYRRFHTSGCTEYMEARKIEINRRISRLPLESRDYLSTWKATFVDRLPNSIRHLAEEMGVLKDDEEKNNDIELSIPYGVRMVE